VLQFITEKAHNMNNLNGQQKGAMLILLALSVGNFLSTTTTPRSPLPFIVIRGICDLLNISHSIMLILLSVWIPRLAGDCAVLCRWLVEFRNLANTTSLPADHVAAVVGTITLLLGLVRVASDLKIDTMPQVREVPVVICGLLLVMLIPANVVYRAEKDAAEGSRAVAASSACHVLTTALLLALVDLGAPPQR